MLSGFDQETPSSVLRVSANCPVSSAVKPGPEPCHERLPFDQNCLAALCAPRPVLFSNAQEDQWANPSGQFEVLQAADPVYRFLGVEGLTAKEMPPLRRLVDSRLGYYIREGKHSMTADDWEVFMNFADRHFGRPKK